MNGTIMICNDTSIHLDFPLNFPPGQCVDWISEPACARSKLRVDHSDRRMSKTQAPSESFGPVQCSPSVLFAELRSRLNLSK